MDQSMMQDQFSLGLISVWVIQRLKALKWLPFVTDNTEKLNRFLSALGAAAASVGLTIHYDPTGGVMTLSGLTATSAVSFLLTVVWQGFVQEGLYRAGKATGVFKRNGATAAAGG